jgi:uncharacterized membrane protein
MNNRSALIADLYLLGSLMLFAGLTSRSVIGPVPIHLDLNGKPDSYAPKQLFLLIWPLFGTSIMVTRHAVASLGKSKIPELVINRFNLIMVGLLVCVLILGGVMLHWNSLPPFVASRALSAPLFLFLAGLGYAIKDIPRNRLIGIRTKAILSTDKIWIPVHVFAGTFMAYVGWLCFGLALIGMPLWMPLLMYIGASLTPLLYAKKLVNKLE